MLLALSLCKQTQTKRERKRESSAGGTNRCVSNAVSVMLYYPLPVKVRLTILRGMQELKYCGRRHSIDQNEQEGPDPDVSTLISGSHNTFPPKPKTLRF